MYPYIFVTLLSQKVTNAYPVLGVATLSENPPVVVVANMSFCKNNVELYMFHYHSSSGESHFLIHLR